ncbi:RpiR family transcriptional regulator [Hypericibacter terrae]|uniref:RpiR family transcriptional regulator n=1 Tax=Hypericibacter terrae TaxID=2602015 RepID=A0A5J6ME91_9PROT|nr:MurR/RpiR family transcriptional regulator [Hypericibacter terrae]QEX15712.1 RpiR family transcriptional regulator [Hypericibacter terrae]
MKAGLTNRLRKEFSGLSKAEKAVASYMLTNMSSLPFETAASIAESVGVSQMTVSRFLRALGYRGLSDLKDKMRNELDTTPLLISDRVDRIRKQSSRDSKLWDNFELEMQATIGVYELRATRAWKRSIEILAKRSDVYVAGFQTIAGIASDFAARLDYVRPNVRLLDRGNGTFAELLAGQASAPCLVLFEMRRYTRLSHQLARSAVDAGIPVIIICDNHCHWARDYTEEVLSVSTDSHLFWDSQAPFLSLVNLLFDDLIARLGDKVAERIRAMRELQDRFEAFQD